MANNLIKLISNEKILPIIRSNKAQTVIDTANAMIDGGVKIIEINVESPEVYQAIEHLADKVSVCAGGIITSVQAKAAIESGAKVLTSPIFSMNLLKFSKDKQIPFIAGTSTANEAYNAWKARIPLVKIYPITAMGGAMYVEDLLRPMPFLNILPSGNVKLDEVKSYIEAGACAVGVGRDLYDGYSLSEITQRAKRVIEEIKCLKN